MAPHFGPLARRRKYMAGKLVRCEAAEDRDEPVVPRNGVEA